MVDSDKEWGPQKSDIGWTGVKKERGKKERGNWENKIWSRCNNAVVGTRRLLSGGADRIIIR